MTNMGQPMHVAEKRKYQSFDYLNIYLEFYNNSGRHFGANKTVLSERKTKALEVFRLLFEDFRENLVASGWFSCVSFGFGDEE